MELSISRYTKVRFTRPSTISFARRTAFSAFLIACFLCQAVFGQDFTPEDSASFQRSLAKSNSDANSIYYQLKLADYFIRKSGRVKSDQDMARSWLGRAKKINEKLNSAVAEGHILLEEARLMQSNRKSKESLDTVTKALVLLKNSPDKCLLALAYRTLFNCYDPENPQKIEQKTDAIKQSLVLFDQCGDRLQKAMSLQDLAEMYLSSGNFPLALKSLNECEAIMNELHYKKLQKFYYLFGTYYFIQADYANCLKFQYKALDICKQNKDSSSLYCDVTNMIGLSLIDLEQYTQAIPCFQEALLISKKNSDTSSVFFNSINLASCFSYIQKPKDALEVMNVVLTSYNSVLKDVNGKVMFDAHYLGILSALHENEKASRCANEMLNVVNHPGLSKFNRVKDYQSLSDYYFQMGNYDKAESCLSNNEEIITKAGMSKLKAQNLKSWYKLNSARKDYKGAFHHLLEYKAIEDSVFNEKKIQQIQQLQVTYEIQKKEDDIKILTQNAKISKGELMTAKLIRNVTLGVIIFVILIVMLQYRRYVEKQKINLLITEKNIALQQLVQEKEWLLKEVHHRVKNNLHTVICLLESQASYLESDALKAIENSRHRIYAMSLIHQKLYQSDDIKVVDMKIYLTEFVDYLKESFGCPENIHVILNTEAVKLGAAQAIPIGLIINEAVNNAFKYAFPTQQNGEIKIELKRVEDEIYLSVSDNGVGFKQQSGQEIKSLGLELIKGLTLDLRGTVYFDTDNGTSIRIRFKIDHLI